MKRNEKGIETKSTTITLHSKGQRHWATAMADAIQYMESHGWAFQSLSADISDTMHARAEFVRFQAQMKREVKS